MNISRQQFNSVYSQYATMLFQIAYSYLKDTSLSEDVMQNSFLKLLLNKKDIPDDKLKFWLVRVVINECKTILRKNKKLAEVDVELLPDKSKDNDILELVYSLDEKYRQVIVLHYYQGFKTDEIAKTLNVSQSAVLKRLERARQMLKKIIGGSYDD